MGTLREAVLRSNIVVEEPTSAILKEHFVTIGSLRYVLPYYFDFKLHAKKRMAGQSIVDLFTTEFAARTRDYYEAALLDGRLRVEGALDNNGFVKEGQCCRHFLHRHEPPVPAGPVEVLMVTDDIVAVSKPPGMPVHVTGQYRKNTVIGVLEAERSDLGKLLPVHRLDKPVSGILLFARHSKSADALRQKITSSSISKCYTARVLGEFQADPVTVREALSWDGRTGVGRVREGHAGEAEGLPEGAKSAETAFTRLSYDPVSDTSVVDCRPLTGRTHQIRLHLLHLGHPIANDSLYGGTHCGAQRRRADREAAHSRPAVGEGSARPASRAAPAPAPAPAPEGVPGPDAAPGSASCAGGAAAAQPRAASGESVEHAAKRARTQSASDAASACASAAASVPAAQQHEAVLAGGAAQDEAAPPVPASLQTGDGAQAGAPGSTAGSPEPQVPGDAASQPGVAGIQAPEELEAEGLAARVPEGRRDELCQHCPSMSPVNYCLDLQPLWLHAREYSCADWTFLAPLPPWAAMAPVASPEGAAA